MHRSIRSRRFRALAALALATSFASPPTSLAVTQAQPGAAANRSVEQPPIPNNAALQYWLAFAEMPPMNDLQKSIVENAETAELNQHAVRLIEDSANCLRQLHRGAALTECNWGLHYEDGPMLLLPHLAKARDLARLACLRARYEFQQSDSSAAADDLADALALARQGGKDVTIIAILVQDAIEQMVVNVAAEHLASLKGPALDQFANRLAHLPAGGSLKASAARIEFQFGLDWLIDQLEHVKPNENWQDRLAIVLGESSPKIQELVKQSGGDVQTVIKRLEATRPYYEQAPALFDLPPDQFRARAQALYDNYSKDAWGKLMLPNYLKAYDRHMSAETRLTMLKAAVAIQKSGPDALKDFTDPAGTGPFEYEAKPKGFELRSKLTVNGAPVTLSVGPKGR